MPFSATGNTLRLSLARHRQEGPHYPCATLGGSLNALGSADQRRILGHLLQQNHLPDHDRQRVVQLMGNARLRSDPSMAIFSFWKSTSR